MFLASTAGGSGFNCNPVAYSSIVTTPEIIVGMTHKTVDNWGEGAWGSKIMRHKYQPQARFGAGLARWVYPSPKGPGTQIIGSL